MMFYDLIVLLGICFLLLWIYIPNSVASNNHTIKMLLVQYTIGAVAVSVFRAVWKIYKQIWRYASAATYLRLFYSDICASIVFLSLNCLAYFSKDGSFLREYNAGMMRPFSVMAINMLASIAIRLLYQYAYAVSSGKNTKAWGIVRKLILVLTGVNIVPDEKISQRIRRINIAIIGAGKVGAMLAEELITNPMASYQPCCFVDINKKKAGRQILGIDVLSA